VLASSTLLVALAALIGGAGQRGLARLPAMLLWVLGALVVSKPLGLRLQRYTTLADIEGRWLVEVRPLRRGKAALHRVVFE
jgi:hypothetical protein